jgi:hypothetical protein
MIAVLARYGTGEPSILQKVGFVESQMIVDQLDYYLSSTASIEQQMQSQKQPSRWLIQTTRL